MKGLLVRKVTQNSFTQISLTRTMGKNRNGKCQKIIFPLKPGRKILEGLLFKLELGWATLASTSCHMCAQTHTCTLMHTYTCAYTCMYIYTHSHTCTHIHTYMYTHSCIYIHICTHTHTQSHIHRHTETHTRSDNYLTFNCLWEDSRKLGVSPCAAAALGNELLFSYHRLHHTEGQRPALDPTSPHHPASVAPATAQHTEDVVKPALATRAPLQHPQDHISGCQPISGRSPDCSPARLSSDAVLPTASRHTPNFCSHCSETSAPLIFPGT